MPILALWKVPLFTSQICMASAVCCCSAVPSLNFQSYALGCHGVHKLHPSFTVRARQLSRCFQSSVVWGLAAVCMRPLPACAPDSSCGSWGKGCMLRSCSDLGLWSTPGNLEAYMGPTQFRGKAVCHSVFSYWQLRISSVFSSALRSGGIQESCMSDDCNEYFKCLQLCFLEVFWS